MEYFQQDEVTQGAIDALRVGRTHGRPLFEAADRIVQGECELRQHALRARAEGYEGPLDPNLFPQEVFDDQGNRLTHADGSLCLTDTEARRAFEWEDSRASFS